MSPTSPTTSMPMTEDLEPAPRRRRAARRRRHLRPSPGAAQLAYRPECEYPRPRGSGSGRVATVSGVRHSHPGRLGDVSGRLASGARRCATLERGSGSARHAHRHRVGRHGMASGPRRPPRRRTGRGDGRSARRRCVDRHQHRRPFRLWRSVGSRSPLRIPLAVISVLLWLSNRALRSACRSTDAWVRPQPPYQRQLP